MIGDFRSGILNLNGIFNPRILIVTEWMQLNHFTFFWNLFFQLLADGFICESYVGFLGVIYIQIIPSQNSWKRTYIYIHIYITHILYMHVYVYTLYIYYVYVYTLYIYYIYVYTLYIYYVYVYTCYSALFPTLIQSSVISESPAESTGVK